MTLQECIEKINSLKSNDFDEDQLTKWIEECENYLIDSIFNKAEGMDLEKVDYDYGDDPELLVPEPYSEIYIYYVSAKIDFFNSEDTYNNSVVMYNASVSNFAAYYRRENRPKRRHRKHTFIH